MNAVPLWEWFSAIPESERFPLAVVLIVFGFTFLVLVVGVVAHTVKSIHKNRLDDALKRELIDRGLSAEEIERIVAAQWSVSKVDG